MTGAESSPLLLLFRDLSASCEKVFNLLTPVFFKCFLNSLITYWNWIWNFDQTGGERLCHIDSQRKFPSFGCWQANKLEQQGQESTNNGPFANHKTSRKGAKSD